MSTLEDRLREAFRADAETVRPEAIPGPPAPPARPRPRWFRSRRARVLIPLAAAAAVVAIVAGVSLAIPRPGPGPDVLSPGGPGPTPNVGGQQPRYPGPAPRPRLASGAVRQAATSASPATVPPFYVTFGGGPLVVRYSATGQVAGDVTAPPGTSGFGAVAATGDSTFVAAVLSSQQNACLSQLYEFRLNGQGHPGPLMPLQITVPGNFAEVGTLAVTPGGDTIAYSTQLCGYSEGEVGVISLAARQVRVWTTYGDNFTWGISLSADASWLAYGAESGGAWVLRTSAPAGPASRYARTVSRTAGWSALAADGGSLYDCVVSPVGSLAPSHGTVTYYAVNLATGTQRVLARWPGLPSPQCWASLDPSGRYLLVQLPTTPPPSDSDFVRPVILDVRSGQTKDVPAPAFYGPLDVAW